MQKPTREFNGRGPNVKHASTHPSIHAHFYPWGLFFVFTHTLEFASSHLRRPGWKPTEHRYLNFQYGIFEVAPFDEASTVINPSACSCRDYLLCGKAAVPRHSRLPADMQWASYPTSPNPDSLQKHVNSTIMAVLPPWRLLLMWKSKNFSRCLRLLSIHCTVDSSFFFLGYSKRSFSSFLLTVVFFGAHLPAISTILLLSCSMRGSVFPLLYQLCKFLIFISILKKYSFNLVSSRSKRLVSVLVHGSQPCFVLVVCSFRSRSISTLIFRKFKGISTKKQASISAVSYRYIFKWCQCTSRSKEWLCYCERYCKNVHLVFCKVAVNTGNSHIDCFVVSHRRFHLF